ncbi:membrane steroid-binding protein 2 isoform X2 [Drosophila innubila]|uniref:membrane steroid-binding protein 2 isoform X2 n=1 Tax=Drosophila innubila TaxID=198719 RepID=UPI00148B4015|nr:membrane steroid-binding protein 2 isoform X2 [Drosophila innubila]
MSLFFDNMWIYQLRDWISSPLGIVVLSCILGYIAYIHARREHPTYDDEDYEKEGHVMLPAPLRNLKLTREELKTYDSQNPNGRYLVCLQNKIYDVSCSPEDFGPNGCHKELTGTDIMWYIKKTLRYEPRTFDEYVEEFEKRLEDRFFVAGVLLEDKDARSANSSDSGWDTVNESSIEADFEEVQSEEDRDEEQITKVEDLEETLMWTKADKPILVE